VFLAIIEHKIIMHALPIWYGSWVERDNYIFAMWKLDEWKVLKCRSRLGLQSNSLFTASWIDKRFC